MINQNSSLIIFTDLKKYEKVISYFDFENDLWYVNTETNHRDFPIVVEFFDDWPYFGENDDELKYLCNILCEVFIKLNNNINKNILQELYEVDVNKETKCLIADYKKYTTYFFNLGYDSNVFYFKIDKVSPRNHVKDWGGFERKIKQNSKVYIPEKCNTLKQLTLEKFQENDNSSDVVIFKNPNQSEDKYDCYLKDELYIDIINQRNWFDSNYKNINDVFKPTDMNKRILKKEEINYMLSKFEGEKLNTLKKAIYKPTR